MTKQAIIVLACLLLLSACGGMGSTLPEQTDKPQAQTALPELEKTEWQAVSTDAEAFNLNGSFDNPNFEYVFEHTDTVPLDQLIAFMLVADAASEGANNELRSRFLEAPNVVLAYLELMGDQITELPGWEPAPTAELICQMIASADAAWYDGSEEFAQTMAACRETYSNGRISELLDVMEKEHAAIYGAQSLKTEFEKAGNRKPPDLSGSYP